MYSSRPANQSGRVLEVCTTLRARRRCCICDIFNVTDKLQKNVKLIFMKKNLLYPIERMINLQIKKNLHTCNMIYLVLFQLPSTFYSSKIDRENQIIINLFILWQGLKEGTWESTHSQSDPMQ